MSLNNELCIDKPTVIDLNHAELYCYPFIISIDKCNESCNAVDHVSTKTCVSSKIEDANIKIFNLITTKNKVETSVKHIPAHCKCKSNSSTCNSNQKGNNN